MQPIENWVRAVITAYTSSLIIIVSSFVFLTTVPFIPSPPSIPLVVALALGALSLKNRGAAMAALYLLVYFAILWQMIGFGFFQLLQGGVGITVIVILAVPLLSFLSKRVELTSLAVAVLAVAVMLTPAYIVSVPLIAATALITDFASVGALATGFILFLTPLLLLENSLYFTSAATPATPIIFSQLSYLSANLRPPLPALNVLLTGLPPDYLSQSARAVSRFLLQDSGVLIIPLVILCVVLLSSLFAGVVTRSLLYRFPIIGQLGRFGELITPVSVSMIVPGVFVLLISLLSQPGSGGFQSSFSSDRSGLQGASMVGASLLLTATLVGRETLIRRLERVQVGTDRLLALMDESKVKMVRVRDELQQLSHRVPSLSLSFEETALTEYSSYISDVERQLKSATNESVKEWQSHLEESILRPLNEEPERLKAKLAGEIRRLTSVTTTVNANLDEAGVSLRYSEIPPLGDGSVEEMMRAYEDATSSIREMTLKLTELYISTSVAFGTLTGLQEMSPPVSPTALVESHEYVTAMRLVSEEYWLNFHVRWQEQFEAKKSTLLERIQSADEFLDEEATLRLGAIAGFISKSTPAGSIRVLEKVRELRTALDELLSRMVAGAELVQQMVASLEPKASKVLTLGTIGRLDDLVALRKELSSIGGGLDALVGFLERAVPILASRELAWRNDRENIAVLAQYPLAKRIIQKMLGEQKRIQLDSLPYQHKSALLYARLYASANTGVIYAENKEELAMSDA